MTSRLAGSPRWVSARGFYPEGSVLVVCRRAAGRAPRPTGTCYVVLDAKKIAAPRSKRRYTHRIRIGRIEHAKACDLLREGAPKVLWEWDR